VLDMITEQSLVN